VAEYILSKRAETDFDGIAAYTITTWGPEQCARYLGQLEACCQQLAEEPQLGRSCDQIRPGLFRYEQGKHVVFYRLRPYGIRVIAVLHERMLPVLHLIDDEDEDDE
jgi:toxin ParE1/3/4